MLTSLSINNFTIVSKLQIDFERGMTAFTGETGAGKSIMIDALSFLLGARADMGFIRDGQEGFDLSASFMVNTNPEANAWLQSNELNADEELILRRTLTVKGRSRAFINGALYPLQKIRELGDLLLQIHGQNEQYHLLRHDVHCQQLDAFASNSGVLNKVQQAYKTLHAVELEIHALENAAIHDDQKALLLYQLAELDSLALNDGEVSQLHAEHKLLIGASDMIQSTEEIVQIMGVELSEGLLSGFTQLQHLLHELEHPHPSLMNLKELINGAQIQLDESVAELAEFQQQLDIDPARLHEVEKRLEVIFDLARKHNVRSEELLEHQAALNEQLKGFEQNEQCLADLKLKQKALLEEYKLQAQRLSKRRTKEAPELARLITQLIKTLGMPNGEVVVQMEALDKASLTGMDKVEYMVSLNPGSALRPLGKIASGGELSRLSLAIQVLTAEKKSYPTLMFDEVDTGIGGTTAAKVGQLLRRLGTHTQVFCVTHQAQVASNANWHIKVEKIIENNQTYSQLCVLIGEDKIQELARMISGVEMTEQTMAHARALLEQIEL